MSNITPDLNYDFGSLHHMSLLLHGAAIIRLITPIGRPVSTIVLVLYINSSSTAIRKTNKWHLYGEHMPAPSLYLFFGSLTALTFHHFKVNRSIALTSYRIKWKMHSAIVPAEKNGEYSPFLDSSCFTTNSLCLCFTLDSSTILPLECDL